MKFINTLFLFAFATGVLNAQNCDYNFTVSNNTYQDLTNAVSLNNGNVWDDPAYTIPVGFDFEVCGNVYTSIYITDLGYGGSLFSEQTPQGVLSIIVPFAQDIVDRGFGSSTSQSPLSYKTDGTVGNRILKVEWNNVGFLTASNDYMNFQLWLYENSNTVEYHFGQNSINTYSFEGETGPITTFYPLTNWDTGAILETGYFLTGNPANPTAVQINSTSDFPANALNGMIPNGTIYTFTPSDFSTIDNEKFSLALYPNPVDDFLVIENRNSKGELQVAVYSLLGEKIKSFEEPMENKINLSDLVSGMYFVKIKNDEGLTETKKIIKR
jgi:hypothetical protein